MTFDLYFVFLGCQVHLLSVCITVTYVMAHYLLPFLSAIYFALNYRADCWWPIPGAPKSSP